MTYCVEISSLAEAEVDSAFLRLAQVTSLSYASQWHSGLLKAIGSLSTMPRRCPLAKENEYFSQEIRQLLYGQRRNLHRVLFTILEEVSIVRILHIRHFSQPTIGEAPEDPDPS
jgi:plasmid stabilization system protein ParE